MDLDADGFDDIITGQYHPGEITWFRGSEEGFRPGIHLEQEGNPAANANPQFGQYDGEPGDIGTFTYWNYSTASFGDLDGDGDQDLVVGGFNSIRISENIGTPTEPKFGVRETLFDTNGTPLSTMVPTEETIARYRQLGEDSPTTIKASPYVVDWDNDGILDILVTDSYTSAEHMAVTFFRGTPNMNEIRFEPGVDLLKTSDGSKALPGSCHRITVADWNNDGIQDLIIGASVATVNDGVFNDELSWTWESVTEVQSAGKDPGRNEPRPRPTLESIQEMFGDRMPEERIQSMYEMNVKYWDDTIGKLYDEGKEYYLTMRHQGRVYVMLGTNGVEESTSSNDPQTNDTPLEFPELKEQATAPVTFTFNESITASAGDEFELKVSFDVLEEWHIYAPTGVNEPKGMAETQITYELPDGFEMKGEALFPLPLPKGPFEILKGKDVEFLQLISIRSDVAPGLYEIHGQVRFQTCNQDFCLPPQTSKIAITVKVE